MSPASVAGEAVTTKAAAPAPRTRQLDTGLEANAWSNSSRPSRCHDFLYGPRVIRACRVRWKRQGSGSGAALTWPTALPYPATWVWLRNLIWLI